MYATSADSGITLGSQHGQLFAEKQSGIVSPSPLRTTIWSYPQEDVKKPVPQGFSYSSSSELDSGWTRDFIHVSYDHPVTVATAPLWCAPVITAAIPALWIVA